MSALSLTCDREGSRRRVAVWQGDVLRDLYLDDLVRPDMTGAVVLGKVARLLPRQKLAMLDAGLATTITVTFKESCAAGSWHRVRLTTAPRQGKPWQGTLLGPSHDTRQTALLQPPPTAWQRAVLDSPKLMFSALRFANHEDFQECRAWAQAEAPHLLSALLPPSSAPVHPQLDDMIAGLLQTEVLLLGGGNLVIEATEALVAIDVNGPESINPLALNLAAIKEAARQIRWRNLSGIIVIDTLKLKHRADNAKLLNVAAKALAGDPAGAQGFGLSRLGLLELTRRHRGPPLADYYKRRAGG